MKTPRNRVRRARRGMTLVEIVVVIALLTTIMSAVAFGVVQAMESGNVDTTKLIMAKLDQNLSLYAAKHKGKFPTTSEGLEATSKYFADGKVPKDAWGNDFQYFSPGTHSTKPYEIMSLGKDGQEGGEDYDADLKSWEDSEE